MSVLSIKVPIRKSLETYLMCFSYFRVEYYVFDVEYIAFGNLYIHKGIAGRE